MLTGLDECTFVCSREDLFATEHSDFAEGHEIRGRRSVALLDGEEHRRVHAVLSSFFAASRVAAMRGAVIRPVIAQRLDALAGRDAAELAADFADRIPGRIIAGLLGLPMDDEELVRRYDRWSLALTPWVRTRGEDELARATAARAAREMTAALRPFVLERRTHRRDDLISLLWQVGPSLLAEWSEEDVLDQCRILFLAGGEGVAQLVCTVLYLVLTAADLRQAVEDDRRAVLPRLVEEALRRHPPAQLRPRRATRDVALDGAVVRCGDLVYPRVQEANLDPSRFSNPETLDLDRPTPSRHLAFNVGPRHCVGAALSRAVAVEAVGALLDRLPGIRLRSDADRPALVGFRFRGFRPLHVLLSSSSA